MAANNEVTPEGGAEAPTSSSGLSVSGSAVRPGQVIGEFELREVIGRGGMGTVYKAWQRSLRRLVALKVLAPHVASSRASIVRFQREAQAAAKLHHPHIVPIFALGEDNGTYFYAMELIEGQGLQDIIREERQRLGLETADEDLDATRVLPRTSSGVSSSAQAASLTASDTGVILAGSGMHAPSGGRYERIAEHLARVADALEYAHQQGVIHRDIKPHNLMLSRDGRLLVTDFGLARVLEQPGITMTSEVVGSPLYMAPEQIRGEGTVDRRSDVYSLAATMYEWLTLEPPFPGKTREAVITQILSGGLREPRAQNPAIPADLETICLKGMEREQNRRYATAAELRDDLMAFLGAGRIRATRVGLLERGRRFVNRNRAGAAAIGLLLVAVVSGLIIWRQTVTIHRMGDGRSPRREVTREGPPRSGNARPDPGRRGEPPPPPPAGDGAPADPIGRILAGLVPGGDVMLEVGKGIVDKNAPSLAEQAEGLTEGLSSFLRSSPGAADYGSLQSLTVSASVEIFKDAGPLRDVLFMFDDTDVDRRVENLLTALKSRNPEADIDYLTNTLLKADPEDTAARYVRAVLYGKTGQYAKMAADASELISRRPDDPYALLVHGLASLMAGSVEEARKDISAALALQQGLYIAHSMQGLVELHLKNPNSALASFSTALEGAPDSVLALLGRALTSAELRDFGKAIADLDRVLDIDPHNVDALVLRGDCKLDSGKFQDAEQDYHLAVQETRTTSSALLSKFFSARAQREKASVSGNSSRSSAAEDAPAAPAAGQTQSTGTAAPQPEQSDSRNLGVRISPRRPFLTVEPLPGVFGSPPG